MRGKYPTLIIFLAALLPRIFGLAAFLTFDEPKWMDRSAAFLTALLTGNYAATFQTGHPGVITMWLGSAAIIIRYLMRSGASLLTFAQSSTFFSETMSDPLPFFVVARSLLALTAAVCIAGIYHLTSKLFDRATAFVAALLIALSPFYIAHSRVLHLDALMTSFMTLSTLSLIIYLQKGNYRSTRSVLHLLFSGCTCGLAILSKSIALFLFPFAVLIGFVHFFQSVDDTISLPRRVFDTFRRTPMLLILTTWGLTATLTCGVLFPALWVAPFGTIAQVLGTATEYAATPHDNFFLGAPADDPGALFYPVSFLLRTTPVTLLGLVLLLGKYVNLQIRKWANGQMGKWTNRYAALAYILIYAVAYTIFVSLSAKKFDRYYLPVFPMLNIAAAVGLLRLRTKARAGVMALLSVAFYLITTMVYHPYYHSYYNPLTGGALTAPKLIMVGWGEGLEKAAQYLNTKEDAARLRVASWSLVMAPYFEGQTFKLFPSFPSDLIPWIDTDYVVFYVNQVQRARPDPVAMRFFHHHEPEYTVRLKGMDYAWVHRVPENAPALALDIPRDLEVDFADRIKLWGYDLPRRVCAAGDEIALAFYWQSLSKMTENYSILLHLVDREGNLRAQYDTWLDRGNFPTSGWVKKKVMLDQHDLVIPAHLPAGRYRLVVGWYDPATMRRLPLRGAAGDTLTLDYITISSEEKTLVPQYSLDAVVLGDEIALEGYDLQPRTCEQRHAPCTLHLTLHWRARRDVSGDYVVFTHLLGQDGQVWGQQDNKPDGGFYPTNFWRAGEVITDKYEIAVDPTAPPGVYHLEVGMYLPATGERVPVFLNGERVAGDRVLLEQGINKER